MILFVMNLIFFSFPVSLITSNVSNSAARACNPSRTADILIIIQLINSSEKQSNMNKILNQKI